MPISVPGRHAARRGTAGLVPEGLRGRVALHPAHLSVVAVAVALAMGWCCWWLVRGETEPVLTPVVSVDPTASTPRGPAGGPMESPVESPVEGAEQSPVPGSEEGAAQPAAERATSTVTVDVAGKVRRPGIAVLPAGSRVVDALESAGGARPGVDLTGLNLARLLVDGEQVLVGMPSVPGGPPVTPPPTAGATGGPAALVNINTADQTTLETLPGVGPVTAGAIIGWRSENGGFSSVAELLEVDGIGEVTLDQLSPLVTL
ncbi:ComEA family DNA-binding protein [Nocardioides houyundeii]|uniref:ComEA family DNA-binding protein n=1 Tax=Nocardioides houyundeii TaxID=2045452 RepID=UPI0018F016DE|nr:ComEA family DNA-binding protein [Nocardioides houyundeii]